MEERRVGELERLGPDGRDWMILGVEADGFEELDLRQKRLAYYLYRAALAGNDILYFQNHRFAFEIKELLETVLLHSRGLPAETREAVHDYLKYIWINHGQYDALDGTKVRPNALDEATLKAAVAELANRGVRFVVAPGETLAEKLERLRPAMFDPEVEPVLTEQREGRDIVASSAVNFWEPGTTALELEALPEALRNKINVRFARDGDGRIRPEVYRIGGLFDRELGAISHFLDKAIPFAESEEQRAGLEALLDYYRTGDEALFRAYSVQWLKSDTVIDYLNGFIEQYRDPRGIIASFEANVSFAADSVLVRRLAENALYFEQRMPWPDRYKRESVQRPVASVVKVIVETGDSGPYSPLAYNLPNYTDLRRDVGSKNVILLNIESARSERIREATIREFYLPEVQELVRKHGELGSRWETYMHEVIGHGSGRPDPDAPGDPRLVIGRAFSALEECRADLVALYHLLDPKLAEIGAFAPDEQRDVALATYQQFLQGHLNGYRRYEDEFVREAHQKGRQLVLMYLHSGGAAGREDYGVRVIEAEGKVYVRIGDLDKARRGVGDLLGRIQVIKSTGDAKAAAELFDRFGSRVDLRWRDDIRARAAKLNLPNRIAFVFPQLVPVWGPGGELADVGVAYEEDLTAQQLRWSRLGGVVPSSGIPDH